MEGGPLGWWRHQAVSKLVNASGGWTDDAADMSGFGDGTSKVRTAAL